MSQGGFMKSIFVFLVFLSASFSVFADENLPHFYEVVKYQLYRGARPTDQGIRQLAQWKFKTIINLIKEDPEKTQHEEALVKSSGMTFVHIPLSSFFKPSDKDMNNVETLLNRADLKPIFVHCQLGKDRTGLAIGLFRVFTQHEPAREAYQEMVSLGFNPMLRGLLQYFEEKTGFRP